MMFHVSIHVTIDDARDPVDAAQKGWAAIRDLRAPVVNLEEVADGGALIPHVIDFEELGEARA